jgi:phosphoribosylanthranilate isomerase
MLNTEVIVMDVTNLTDARYFAAWHVDYIVFNCNVGEDTYVNPEQLTEIKEWIEGPKFLGNFNGLAPVEEIEERVEQLGLDGLVLGHFTPEATLKNIDAEHLFIQKKIVDSSSPISAQTILSSDAIDYKNHLNKQCYLDISGLDLDIVKEIIPASCGLVLRGGDEEKVGFKSYDFLDEVFEVMMG